MSAALTDTPKAEVPKGRTMVDPNMTPMIDVLLVLLVIFILAQQVLQRSIDVQLPVDKEDESAPELPPIVLEFDASGLMFLNKTYVTEAQLPGMLEQVYRDRPAKLLFIKAIKGVTYGEVLTAMDVARGAGIEVLGAMLPTMEEWAQARPGEFN
ncbi:MAG: protein TolR [Gemmatimonadetes bacterium]|nr:protein TolR [Gemmatimonadota bacterium]